MYTIFLNSEDQGHNLETFNERFIEICNEHKANSRALAFAFILYDFMNEGLHSVLNKPEYWLSLNATSGKYLTVFSLNYMPALTNGFLTSVTSEINPSIDSNILIERYFGRDVTVKYPAVMFFQIQNDQVLDYELIELSEERIEESFGELKIYITKTVEVLKGISPQYVANNKEIFDLVKAEVKGIRRMTIIKKGIKTLTSAYEIGSTILGS
ncbi:MAG: hypothetical protein AAGC65_12490 [Mucilaginibacter sp.]|uniref:hypothetical protein n=1 Tax=Mucilaginibacter sp. TaxID=1882438 RepID=UPI0031B07B03